MCGICGELRFESTTGADEREFEYLVDMMARRGPDDRGVWAGGLCRLGFRRLSILDLSATANQPMVAGDRYALVFNGEVYNFRELRVDLERRGAAFHTTGDTEVVLQALIHWGKDALDRFNGMFALGFYDAQSQTLLLARDTVGIKPLYVLTGREGLFFASQYDQILAHPWSERRSISPDALGLFLRLGYVPAPYAMLEGTAMLEPGSWLEVTAGGQTARGRYYSFPVYQPPDLRGNEAYEAVGAAVTSAVRRQMVSDVPLGTFLSGGIDSPLVTANAMAATNRPLRAFTIGSDDPVHDETADALEYGRRLGVEHITEEYTPAKAIDWLERVIEACSEPLAEFSIFPTMLVSSLAQRDVKVILSGDGGDELFWGYTFRFNPVLSMATRFRQPHWWRSGHHGLSQLMRGSNDLRHLRWPTIGAWYEGIHTRMPDSKLNLLFPGFPDWPDGYDLFRYDGWQPDQTAQWLRWNEIQGHLTRVLLKVDRASMYHSLEVRVPLLDREVLDTAARVDWQSCLDLANNVGKIPLRRALATHVDFQSHHKRGFTIPMGDWLRGPLLPVFRDVVLERSDLLGMPINRPALEDLLNGHLNGRHDQSWWLWTILSLALWSERHLSQRASARGRALA